MYQAEQPTYYQATQENFPPPFVDPYLMRVARNVYRIYSDTHPDRRERPLGVAVDSENYRAQVLFGRRPILLPREYFIPLDAIERTAQGMAVG